MEEKVNYLTTVDNPWNPATNWDEWYRYDMAQGYHTYERLARLAPISDTLPETINEETIQEAMLEMVKLGAIDKFGNFVEYKIVTNDELTENSK